uniref:Uncharacterized protein n=1 Tax=Malurus cyaneus samueli TaxID=2593467 RepID=A0A8C5X551_9PASS
VSWTLDELGMERRGGGGPGLPRRPRSSRSAGLFRGPDRCSLQFNYGIRNYRLHTVSHCDCDARWAWGRGAGDSEGRREGSPSSPLPSRRKRPRQELRAKPGRRQAWRPKTPQQLQGPGTPASARDKASGCWGHVQGVPLTSPLSSGPGRGCRCKKHLSKCEHQIAPHEMRYQLHNVDSRTLLHCNCTRRCESRRKNALCAYSWGSEEVGCLSWPAPADPCPPVPAGWHGVCTG